METEESSKSTAVPDEATIAKTTIEMLTSDAEIVAAYGAGTLTVRVLMTAVAGRYGVTDAARAKAFFKPTVKATLMDYMVKNDPPITPAGLQYACSTGNLDAIRRLLDGGCDINERDSQSFTTPLFVACGSGQVEAARLLLNRGADVELRGKQQMPPLVAACDAGHYGVVCLLTFVGRANVNCATDKGSTPLLVASSRGHLAMAKILIDRGADVNYRRDQDGLTALLMACSQGHTEIVRLLIDRGGADINVAAPDGRTPFFVACQTGHYDVVELLMHKGAIMDKDRGGVLPLEYAISKGHIAIAELLRPGIMEAVEALKAAKGEISTLSAEQLAALAPIRANFKRVQEAARPAP